MKKLLPAILLLLSLKSNSQSLVLTQSIHEPVIGDTNRTYVLDTTAFSSGLMTGPTGSNLMWNYQNLITTSGQVTSAYVSTTAVNSASNYPGATMVQAQGAVSNFYKSTTSPTTQTEFMGLSSTGITLNFTNTAIVAKYPLAFGTTITDNFSGSFSFSVQGNAAGNVVTKADATGTLNLPGGITFTNVLRVKSVQNMTMTSGFFPVGTIKQTSYTFYNSIDKFPVLSFNYSTITLTSQTPSVTAGATGSQKYFVVGMKENSLSDAEFSVFPNPAKDAFNVNLTNANNAVCTVEIYNSIGTLCRVIALGNSPEIKQTISLTNLSSGIYIVKTTLGAQSSSRRLIIE